MIEIIWTLSYYHHQIGSMNYYPLFMAKSWDNGMRCMSLYILMIITRIIDFNDKFQKYCHGAQFGWGYCEILITLVTSGLACRSCTTTLIKWHVYWFMGMIGLMHIVAVFRHWLMLCLWPVVVLVSWYKLYRMRCCQNITWLVLLCCLVYCLIVFCLLYFCITMICASETPPLVKHALLACTPLNILIAVESFVILDNATTESIRKCQ